MSGSKSPDATHLDSAESEAQHHGTPTLAADGGNGSSEHEAPTKVTPSTTSPPQGEDHEMPDALNECDDNSKRNTDGGDSEAETLIDSPVKRKEAERQTTVVKSEKPVKSRIGGLPVPGEDDDDTDSPSSPVQSVEMSGALDTTTADKAGNSSGPGSRNDKHESSSDALSSPRSAASHTPSDGSPISRPHSERPDRAHQEADSSNLRKRKHRASSVGLPNKRQNKEQTKSRKHDLNSNDAGSRDDRSLSPKPRSHRRAASTQSAVMDNASDTGGRKRRATQQPSSRDFKSLKNGWDDSDESSESTYQGQAETKRPTRGIGRSTSTPGRPPGREHKRHVNKYGFTRLAEACEAGDLDAVKEWREKDPEQLELAEFALNKPLQIAALNGNDEVVAYLIAEGCHIDCANVDKDTPLIDAAENGHLEVVKILLNAGVDPLRQNLKGQQALDVVTDDTDDSDKIRAALREAIKSWNKDGNKKRPEVDEIARYGAAPNKGLHFMARSYENLLKLVTVNDRNGVREFLDARVPVDNIIVAAAAKTGDLYLVNMLLAEMAEKKAYQKPEKPMLAVLGTSHFEVVKMLTELDQFNPLYRSRAGRTWPEIAEEKNGPNVRQERELLQRLYNDSNSNKARRSSSPILKRDSAKRRYAQQESEEDSEDDEQAAPKRKNGRRLMSRRDMRVASGKNLSESDSDESGTQSDAASVDEAKNDTKMKPPDSPKSRGQRLADRQRAVSNSSPAAERSPRQHRRSTSLRGAAENPVLQSVVEEESNPPAPSTESDEAEKQARKQEAQRREDEERAAKVKREEEEKAQRAEAERLQEELRVQQEAQIEEARKAEESRKAEEEVRRQMEMEAAKSKAIEDVLSCLPKRLADVFRSDFDFDSNGDSTRHMLVHFFTPIILTSDGPGPSPTEGSPDYKDAWVVNVQAAPLLGKKGLELLLPRDSAAGEKTFSKDWTTYSVFSAKEQANFEYVLKVLSRMGRREHHDPRLTAERTYQQELEHCADQWNEERRCERAMKSSVISTFCVRLVDVLDHLHPLLGSERIILRSLDYPSRQLRAAKSLDQRGAEEFFPMLQTALDRPTQTTQGPDDAPVVLDSTRVVIVHEK